MPSQLLIDYLQRSHANFELLTHDPAYTALEAAHQAHIFGSHFAKVVMLRVDYELTMVVAPASRLISLEQVRDGLLAGSVELVCEREFRNRFPRCENGALPPFAHLFGMRGLLLPGFDEDGDIAFNAGSHTESIRMPFREFKHLAHADELQPPPCELAAYSGCIDAEIWPRQRQRALLS